MDLSPKLLTDVQFREQWRGYNPDEVDEFLERVASGVEELQRRLSEAIERASSAEHRLLERSDEDEIRRTLVLAQRTAVASMEEARAEADRLVSETEARCRQLVGEAESQAARLDADIATRRQIELGDLAEQRTALQQDVEHLRAFLDAERERIGIVLRGQLDWIESGYSLADVPSISEVVAPAAPVASAEMRASAFVDDAPAIADPEPDMHVDVEAVEVFAPEPVEESSSAVDELRLAREELADALRRAGVEPEGDVDGDVDMQPVSPDEPLQLEPQLPRGSLFDDRVGEPTGAFDVVDVVGDEPVEAADEGPDEPKWRDDPDDDPFLAELRRAVVDTEPLGPRDHDHDPSVGRDDLDDGEHASGFFRRGRRRP